MVIIQGDAGKIINPKVYIDGQEIEDIKNFYINLYEDSIYRQLFAFNSGNIIHLQRHYDFFNLL